MKQLKNNFDKDIAFENLEEAKKYFKPRKEDIENLEASEFLGDLEEFEEYKKNYALYAEEMENAKTLEELADVLNEYSDIYGNGNRYSVQEY